MSKQGKSRTISICVTDIDKSRLLKHENGKVYMNLQTWDHDEPDQFGNDFSVSMARTTEELEKIKAGQQINRVFIGNGRIWPDKGMQPVTQEDHDDLPF